MMQGSIGVAHDHKCVSWTSLVKFLLSYFNNKKDKFLKLMNNTKIIGKLKSSLNTFKLEPTLSCFLVHRHGLISVHALCFRSP